MAAHRAELTSELPSQGDLCIRQLLVTGNTAKPMLHLLASTERAKKAGLERRALDGTGRAGRSNGFSIMSGALQNSACCCAGTTAGALAVATAICFIFLVAIPSSTFHCQTCVQGPKAERLLARGMEQGLWVCLQNCHLAVSWMPALERIVDAIDPDTVHRCAPLPLSTLLFSFRHIEQFMICVQRLSPISGFKLTVAMMFSVS